MKATDTPRFLLDQSRITTAKIQARLEALGLKGKQLQTTLEKKIEEVREIIKREETSRGTAWAQEETHALTQEPTTPELATGPPAEWTAEKSPKAAY